MSRAGKIARRAFLIGSAATVGGVAFGVWRYRTPYDNPLLADLPEGSAALTPYVRVDADGITLITPRADMGQGAYSVQAALIAEELDVPLNQIRTEPGPPDRAYWNTELASDIAPFWAPGSGLAYRGTHATIDAGVKVLGLQITGGSTTVSDSFDRLRQAGASARETLKLAAAQQTGVQVQALSTENGAVILPDGTRLSYSALARVAATITPVQDVPLRPSSAWRLVGKPMQRIDVIDKSTGRQAYGIDLRLPGMRHATVLLNPAQSGALQGFDATEALQMRGIKAVVPVTGGVGIVADNTWRAFQAAEAVKADWGKAPFPATMAEHWQELEQSFARRRDSRRRNDGDTTAALERGPVQSAQYRAPYLAHAPLEPLNATVRVNDDSVEVWTGTQIPRFVQQNVARITGISADNITINVQMMGGSFGHRLEDAVVKHATEIAMQMKGVPVKLTYARETDMAHDFTRPIAMARMRGTVKDGQVETYDLGIAMPAITVSQFNRQHLPVPGPDYQIVAGAWDQPFAIPNHRVSGYRAKGLAPVSSWRSVGASTNGFFYNAGLDELIHAAGADPMAERLRLCHDPLARKVLEAVAEMSGWDGPAPGKNRGRGVALTHSFGVHCAEVVDVTNTAQGIRIDKVWVAAEVGTIVDPVNFENNVQGGVVFALGHAMNCEITYTDGATDQTNFHDYEGMRLYQCPEIIVKGLENGDHVRGIGEPPVPPAAPALAAAIFAATGIRLREMPFNKFVDFV